MSNNDKDEVVARAHEIIDARFFTAAGGKPPTDEQRELVATLRELIVKLGVIIEVHVRVGRNKSLALTALEDVQMRANRAIFEPQPTFATGGYTGADADKNTIPAILGQGFTVPLSPRDRQILARLHKGETIIPGTSLKHQGDAA